MAYYNTVKTGADFLRVAKRNNAVSFQVLRNSTSWQTAVSKWGIQELCATRVICSAPRDGLPLLQHLMSQIDEKELDPVIKGFIDGPGDLGELHKLSESQIVRRYESESLGYVWAALAPLSHRDVQATAASQRPQRDRRRPERFQGSLATVDAALDDSDRTSASRTSTDSSDAPSSSGFTTGARAQGHPVEDFTSRFLNCAVRCIINYCQPLDKESPYLQFRDARLPYMHGQGGKRYEAIDDGGIEYLSNQKLQVAILEAKRCFQAIENDKATISDELLAQLVGEALALRSMDDLIPPRKVSRPSKDDVITVLAVKHFVKFFHFKITWEFIQDFEHLDPQIYNKAKDLFLRVDSTKWIDLTDKSDRKRFVRHLVALTRWADLTYKSGDSRTIL